MARKKKIVIGRRDAVDFPELNLWRVKAKIDTGADTSSIHVRKLKEEVRGNDRVLSCYFRPRKKTIFHDFRQKPVKSSNGISQLRYVVNLRLIIFGREYETEFTLSDREKMSHPVLLGKKFLKGRFIVDVGAADLSVKNKIREL